MIPVKQDQLQQKGEKSSKVNDILYGLTIQHFHFCENYENSSYLSSMCRIYAKNFYVFCSRFSKLLKILKMFDRQSLVNVTLKTRAKFHSNRLVRFRDISHAVSKIRVSRETRRKFQNVIFHAYPSLTFFLLTHRVSQFLQFTTKLNPSPLILDSPNVTFESHGLHFIMLLKVANSDTDSIILYPQIYHRAPK